MKIYVMMKISAVYIEKEIEDHALTNDICARINAPVRVVESLKEVYA